MMHGQKNIKLQILTSTTVSIECISWLIKAINSNDARWKPEIKFYFALCKGRTVPFLSYLLTDTCLMMADVGSRNM